MTYLKKINNRYYQYINKDTKTVYQLEYGDRGIYSQGKSWYLRVIYNGICKATTVASFVVKTDGHQVEREDYGGRLWTFNELFPEANKMIERMEE